MQQKVYLTQVRLLKRTSIPETETHSLRQNFTDLWSGSILSDLRQLCTSSTCLHPLSHDKSGTTIWQSMSGSSVAPQTAM
ncbi:hypothetical protein Rhal01_03132 [Rubritalea halochordaticola]|uniref:Uncharacterized protein n=1 Tax=Rubritalea halochordaticola TaxID=714537 RepID=A0ABP9V4V3_9BACT